MNRNRTLSLAYVRLDGVSIVESRFGNINFLQTRMRGANLATVFIYTGTMSETDFAGATLRDVTFGHFWMGDRSLQAQDLRGARLINVRFQGQ